MPTSWVLIVILIVLGVLVVAWLVRRTEASLAFFPLRGEDVTPKSYGIDYVPGTVTTEDNERIHVWHLPRVSPKARVIYFHGNGGNLSLWSDVLAGLWNAGFEVTALDYRGYGLSTGHPSEGGLYRDVEATLRYVHEELSPQQKAPLIYWGRSLGTTMAAYAATRRPPAGIVLEAGFPTMRSVLETNPILLALSWFSTYRFPTAEWMASVKRPTLVLHGDRDSVIAYRLGQRLFERLNEPKTFFTIPGGDHNDPLPRDPRTYWEAIDKFVASLPR